MAASSILDWGLVPSKSPVLFSSLAIMAPAVLQISHFHGSDELIRAADEAGNFLLFRAGQSADAGEVFSGSEGFGKTAAGTIQVVLRNQITERLDAFIHVPDRLIGHGIQHGDGRTLAGALGEGFGGCRIFIKNDGLIRDAKQDPVNAAGEHHVLEAQLQEKLDREGLILEFALEFRELAPRGCCGAQGLQFGDAPNVIDDDPCVFNFNRAHGAFHHSAGSRSLGSLC